VRLCALLDAGFVFSSCLRNSCTNACGFSITSAIPFITSTSDAYASVEGTFIRNGTANWDDLYVKAVDEHLLITKPVESRRSSVVAKVSGGEHDITIGLEYDRSGWPRNGSVKILANLSVGKAYKLNSRQ
jgi:hypothetical protein